MIKIESINPWDFVASKNSIPDGIRLGISSIMNKDGVDGGKGESDYDIYEKAFAIIVDYWVNVKKFANIRGTKITLTREGERYQAHLIKGGKLIDKLREQRKRRAKRPNDKRIGTLSAVDIQKKQSSNKRRLRDIKNWFTEFNKALGDSESSISKRRDKIRELGYNTNARNL